MVVKAFGWLWSGLRGHCESVRATFACREREVPVIATPLGMLVNVLLLVKLSRSSIVSFVMNELRNKLEWEWQ